jgi:hypothetical protein
MSRKRTTLFMLARAGMYKTTEELQIQKHGERKEGERKRAKRKRGSVSPRSGCFR